MIHRIAPACLAGALLALCLAAAPAARAELRVLAPPDGALLAGTPIVILGSGAEAAIEITVTTSNGVETSGGKISGKAFTAQVKLAPGENTILVKSGDQRQRVVYTLAPGDTSARFFRYHPPVTEGDCRACHPQGVGRTSPVSEAKLCHGCHDLKTGAKVLHGPLGAGQCSICHNPHGSAYPSFLVTGVRALCIQCHAQTRSQKHIEKSANKQCPECHDPHGSEKQLLLK